MVVELRWVLLALGVLILAGIYVWGRRIRKRGAAHRQDRQFRQEPHLSLERDLLAEPGSLSGVGAEPAFWRESTPTSPEIATETDADEAQAQAQAQAQTQAQVEAGSDPQTAALRRREAVAVSKSKEKHPASWLWRRNRNVGDKGRESADGEALTADSIREEQAGSLDHAAERQPVQPREAPARAPDKVVTVRLIPRHHDLDGKRAVVALRNAGLAHGRYKIFHKLSSDDTRETVFSVASLTEPGSFDLDALRAIAGMSFFMVLPGPTDPVKAFDAMVETARELARVLDAELTDDRGSSWSIQRERYLREELIHYRHQHVRP